VLVVRETEGYKRWFLKLRDSRAKARILVRVRRMSLGNFGDSKSLGSGISELRIDYDPGYRIYYTRRGDELIFLLVGGDKSTQQKDIRKAKDLASEL